LAKKCVYLCLCGLALGMGLGSQAAASGRGFTFGFNAGIGPTVWSHSAYRFGVEAGYRFSARLGILIEAETGTTTYESSTEWPSMSYLTSSEIAYTATPISLTLHYIVPLNNRAAFTIGLGGGFYALAIETEDSDPNDRSRTMRTAQKARAFAPHLCLSFECGLIGKMALIGEVKQSAGKTKISTTDPYGFISKQDLSFGGTQVKIGIRIVLDRSENAEGGR